MHAFAEASRHELLHLQERESNEPYKLDTRLLRPTGFSPWK